jgi:hypothetical protein
MKRKLACCFAAFPVTIVLLILPHRHEPCPAAGSDPRICASVVCPLQQALSWHSEREPAHLHTRYSAVSVFPPYVVTNWQSPGAAQGQWMMFRIGWRYDRHWHGYIGPTFAYKPVAQPLLFY